jgi:hypothetical protein
MAIANEDLTARALPAFGGRTDELALLALDFDRYGRTSAASARSTKASSPRHIA